MKIRQDIHGLYGKVDGRIARPLMPIGYRHLPDGTKYTVGQNISARPISGSELVHVGCEWWFTHGNYMVVSGDIISHIANVDTCFKPSHHQWKETEGV